MFVRLGWLWLEPRGDVISERSVAWNDLDGSRQEHDSLAQLAYTKT